MLLLAVVIGALGILGVRVLSTEGDVSTARRGAVDPGRGRSWVYRGSGLTAVIPRLWTVFERPLTRVVRPRQRLVVASFELRQRHPDPGCTPVTALRELPARGVLLYLYEYTGVSRRLLRDTPPRPRAFRLDPRTLSRYECMGRSYVVQFREHHRRFQGHVYLGRRASARTRRRMLALLDSLAVSRPAPRRIAAGTPSPSALSTPPYLGVACPQPNRYACDRVGLAVWLRRPAVRVTACVGGRRFALDDSSWSGPVRKGRRRMLAGFLQPAGLLHDPLRLTDDDGPGRWIGSDPVTATVQLMIRYSPHRLVRTTVRVPLAAGWG